MTVMYIASMHVSAVKRTSVCVTVVYGISVYVNAVHKIAAVYLAY